MNLLLKNFLYTFFVRCMVLGSGFFISIASAHFLGPAGRGEYFFVTSLSALLVQLSCLGMQSSNLFLVSKDQSLMANLTTNAIWVSIITAVILSVITAGIFYFCYSVSNIIFIVILVPASLFYLLATNLLIGTNRINIFNIFQITSNLTVGIILLICGYMGFSSKGFLAGAALVWLFFAILVFFYISQITSLQSKFDLASFRSGLNFGLKSYSTCLLMSLLLKSNVFMLKFFTSSAVLGYYSIASQINDVLVSLPATFALLLFPDIIKNRANGWKITQKALAMFIIFLLIVEILIAFAAPWVIPLVFGIQFSASVNILWWMLPGAFSLCIISIMSQYLAANGFPIELVCFWLISFIIMIVLSSVLIPKFLGIGAAMSLSITYSFLAIMIMIFSYRFKYKIKVNLLPRVLT